MGSSAAPDNYAIFALGHIMHLRDQWPRRHWQFCPHSAAVALAASPRRAHEARWGSGSLKRAIAPLDHSRALSAASTLGVGVGHTLPPRLEELELEEGAAVHRYQSRSWAFGPTFCTFFVPALSAKRAHSPGGWVGRC